jgi:hypothetical protein
VTEKPPAFFFGVSASVLQERALVRKEKTVALGPVCAALLACMKRQRKEMQKGLRKDLVLASARPPTAECACAPARPHSMRVLYKRGCRARGLLMTRSSMCFLSTVMPYFFPSLCASRDSKERMGVTRRRFGEGWSCLGVERKPEPESWDDLTIV